MTGQLKPGAGVTRTHGQARTPGPVLGGHPQLSRCRPRVEAHTGPQAGGTPSSCGTASRRNEPRVGTSSSCPQAPWLGRPCCLRAIVPDVHLQLSLAPTRTQLGPDLIAHPSFTPIFHVLTSVDGGTEPTGANICHFLLGGGHFGLVPP